MVLSFIYIHKEDETMNISIITAIDKNRLIGEKNNIPWKIPKDLEYFKRITMGKTIVMGRKTYESIGKLLDGRENIIITRNKDFIVEGGIIIHSLQELLEKYKNKELFVIGGGEIYQQFLPYASKLYITKIHHEFKGDTYFPEIKENEWIEIYVEKGIKDEENPYKYYYHVYQRSYR